MKKYLINAALGVKVEVPEGASANKLAQLPGLAGNIGKTMILELLRGERQEAKGFQLVEQALNTHPTAKAHPQGKRAAGLQGSREGYRARETSRRRLPNIIHVYFTEEGLQRWKYTGNDFYRFLEALHTAGGEKLKEIQTPDGRQFAFGSGVEYSELCQRLGWDRNLISIYCGRAKNHGLIVTTKQSNKIKPEIKSQALNQGRL